MTTKFFYIDSLHVLFDRSTLSATNNHVDDLKSNLFATDRVVCNHLLARWCYRSRAAIRQWLVVFVVRILENFVQMDASHAIWTLWTSFYLFSLASFPLCRLSSLWNALLWIITLWASNILLLQSPLVCAMSLSRMPITSQDCHMLKGV